KRGWSSGRWLPAEDDLPIPQLQDGRREIVGPSGTLMRDGRGVGPEDETAKSWEFLLRELGISQMNVSPGVSFSLEPAVGTESPGTAPMVSRAWSPSRRRNPNSPWAFTKGVTAPAQNGRPLGCQ